MKNKEYLHEEAGVFYNGKLHQESSLRWIEAEEDRLVEAGLMKESERTYKNRNSDKGLDKPYLTKSKENHRRKKEIPLSSLNEHNTIKVRSYIDIRYDD